MSGVGLVSRHMGKGRGALTPEEQCAFMTALGTIPSNLDELVAWPSGGLTSRLWMRAN
jgi:hypothetical protein